MLWIDSERQYRAAQARANELLEKRAPSDNARAKELFEMACAAHDAEACGLLAR